MSPLLENPFRVFCVFRGLSNAPGVPRTAGTAIPCIFVLPDGLVSTGTVPFLSGSGRLPGRYKLDREAGANQVRAVPRYHFLR